MRGRGRGRGRGTRGRRGGTGIGRTRPKKKVIESDEDESQMELMIEHHDENFPPAKIDMEADISQLEAPTFTTLNRGPPEPMLRLRWDHRVSLIGEKVLNPMIHCCDKCLKPILIYGRMIPCKHVFCLQCGREEEKACPRCLEPVTRVEQTGLGTVFMCTHGGTRYGHSGCRRTYLSQRDLQAHINHRHTSGADDAAPGGKVATIVTPQEPRPRKIPQTTSQNDPRGETSSMPYRNQTQRSNLITVPIQEDQSTTAPPQPPQMSHYHQSGPSTGTAYAAAATPTTAYYTNPPPPGYYPPPYTTPPPPPQYQDPTASYWPHPPPPIHQFYR